MPDGRKYTIVRESHYGQSFPERQQGDSVFTGVGDSQLLYDFRRNPGDTLWNTSNRVNILVTKGDTVLFGRTLRWWLFRRLFGTFGYEFDTVVDSLGLVETGEINDLTWSAMELRGAIIDGRQFGAIDAITPDPIERKPNQFVLQQNFPNPFNPSTTIRYGLPNRAHVTLTVFNTLGQQVAVLQNGEQEAGYHEVKFDASGQSSGVYFYRIEAGSFVQTRKLIYLR